MKIAAPFVILLFVTACDAEQLRSRRLMNEIEGEVKLPKGSRPLASYARYYTDYDGRVVATYKTKVESSPDPHCGHIDRDGTFKIVPCPVTADLQPGNRRWVKFSDFPTVATENCDTVQIVYDPAIKSFVSAECVTPSSY